MVSKGKRRVSQRVKANQGQATRSEGPQGDASHSPVTAPLKMKRRVVVAGASGERMSDLPPSIATLGAPQAINSDHQSSVNPVEVVDEERPPPMVLTPPAFRRRVRRIGSTGDRVEVGRPVQSSRTPRTGETISQDSGSDDIEGFVIRRQPMENSEFYKRYMAPGGREENDDNFLEREFLSPVTPAHNDTHNGTPLGGRQQDDINRFAGVTNSENMAGEGNRNIPNGVCGELLPVTRELMSSFYQEIEHKLLSEVGSIRTLVCENFRVLQSLEKNLTRQLNEIRVVLSDGRTASSTQSRPTPLALYESKLDLSTEHAEWVFNTETLCRVLRVNLPMFVVNLSVGTDKRMEDIYLALRAILFGLLPSQKRTAFISGVGREHSNFRSTVVLNVMFNVQRNVFKRFVRSDMLSGDDTDEISGVVSTGDDGARVIRPRSVRHDRNVSQIKHPDWLKMGFTRKKYVGEARARVESNTIGLDGGGAEPLATGRRKKAWITVKETPDAGDIARYGALKVYRCVTTGLYHAREKGR